MLTVNEKIELLNKLVDNAEFMAAYHNVESKSDLQKLFAQYGVELACEEIDVFVNALTAGNDELDEHSLESVSGGIGPEKIFGWAWSIVKKTGKWAWEKGKELANWEANQ